MPRNLLRFDPFSALSTIQRGFFEDDWLAPLPTGPMPTTDVYTEDDRPMVVESQLPGFAESDVSIDDGAIVLHAQKHEKTEDSTKDYLLRESTSSFDPTHFESAAAAGSPSR